MAEKVVVITGASSGIGAALAEVVAGRGMTAVLVARRQEALKEVAARCGGRAHVLTADVTQRADVQMTHTGIQISLVSPGVVRTDFGKNAVHGGPDSRTFATQSQSPEEVAAVIANVIDSRAPDVYTFPGAKGRIDAYYLALGAD